MSIPSYAHISSTASSNSSSQLPFLFLLIDSLSLSSLPLRRFWIQSQHHLQTCYSLRPSCLAIIICSSLVHRVSLCSYIRFNALSYSRFFLILFQFAGMTVAMGGISIFYFASAFTCLFLGTFSSFMVSRISSVKGCSKSWKNMGSEKERDLCFGSFLPSSLFEL